MQGGKQAVTISFYSSTMQRACF